MLMKKIQLGLTSFFRKEYSIHQNTVLPIKKFRLCGAEFGDDQFYLSSCDKEAERLIKYCSLTGKSRILDVGCGAGRLPIGISHHFGEVEKYRGVDIVYKSIRWCQNYITKEHPNFQFLRLNVENLRYNPAGKKINSSFRFPFENQEFDIIYLYSVFSHMVKEDVMIYLDEFNRLLCPGGKLFFTGFFEEGVPEMSLNPEEYRMNWKRELHCVHYNTTFIKKLLAENDFSVYRFDYETETDGQSAFYAMKNE